jgi:tRNA uracil 4-sulfurtransferase
MEYNYLIIHYAEIGLKGKNRPFFENKLKENIQRAFAENGIKFKSIKRDYGRIIIKLPDKSDFENISKILKNIFGIANFSYAYKKPLEIEEIEKSAIEMLKQENFETFRIKTKRGNKNFPLDSIETDKRIGALVVDKLKKKVNLNKPDKTLFIEITQNETFLYLQKNKGLGGLPVGVSSKTLTLISGGIDSPVAAYLMNKRGVKNIFIHFHSYPYTNRNSIDKVRKVIDILNKYQFESKLYLVSFAGIQKEILDKTPEKFRIILYRRFMLRIAEKIAEKEKINTLTTGESIGQVSSQTLENIKAISEAVNIPILRPLISFDKEEIIDISKKIEVYETSILPCEDACTWFMPENPEIKAKLNEVKKAEENLSVEELVKKGLGLTEQEIVRKKASQ